MLVQTIIEKDINHKVQILEYLYSKEMIWVSTDELVKKISVEQRTILKYMTEIQELITEYCSKEVILLREKNKGYRIKFIKKDSFIMFRLFMINKSIKITILNKIFLSGQLNSVHFSFDHYVSSATFKRKIKIINSLIKDYGFKIVSQEGIYFFKGNEKSIRLFGSIFYWQLYRGVKWPFLNIDQTKIFSFIDKVSKSLNYPVSIILKNKISYNYAIGIIRYSHNEKIELGNQDEWKKIKEINEIVTSRMSTNIYNLFFSEGIRSEDEIHFNISRLQTGANIFENQKLALFVIELHKEKKTVIYQATEAFFKLFLKKMHLKLSDIDKQKVKNIFVAAFSIHYRAFLFQDTPLIEKDIDQTLKTYKQLNNLMDQIFIELREMLNFSLFNQKYLILNQYMYIFSELFPLNLLEKEITIYFDEPLEKRREDLAKNMLNNFLGDQYKLRIFGTSELFEVKQEKIDLIISSSSSEKFFIYYPKVPIIILKKNILNISSSEILLCRRLLELISIYFEDKEEMKSQINKLENVFYKYN